MTSFERLQWWDSMVRTTLEKRRATLDPKWLRHEMLVRNTGTGKRLGNLVRDYLQVLNVRLNLAEWYVGIEADNPIFTTKAYESGVVANALLRCVGFQEKVMAAAQDASWATTGWLEFGHPLAQYPADWRRSVGVPRVDPRDLNPTTGEFSDSYVPIPGLPMGVAADQVLPFDPFQPPPLADPEPVPLLQTDLGYPWVNRVDPRYIVTNIKARSMENLPFVARLRPMTVQELEFYTGKRAPPGSSAGVLKALFDEVEGEDSTFYPDLTFLVELWVRTDRQNPEYSNWLYCYPYHRPDVPIFDGPNPHGGGFLPLQPVKPVDLKAFFDSSLAEELEAMTDILDVGIQAVFRDTQQALNPKLLVQQGSGLTSKGSKDLVNPEYKGEITVQSADAIKQFQVNPLDQGLLMRLGWVRSLAQLQANQSDLDRGAPIKDITARQTSALLEASSLAVAGMKEEIGKAASAGIHKLMYFVGRYSAIGYSRDWMWGGHTVKMDRGTHDFTTNYIFSVKFGDRGEFRTEEVLAWTQLLRTLLVDSGGLMVPFVDLERLVKVTFERFGEDPRLNASLGANRPGRGLRQSADLGVEAGLQENNLTGGGGGVIPNARPTALSLVEGEHPERQYGSRGAGGQQFGSNAVEGARRTGR